MLLTFNIMQAGSTVHLSLHHNSFKICISSRKIDLSCLGLYPFIFRTDLNGSKEDDGVIIVHFSPFINCCIVLHCIVAGSLRLMAPDALQPKAYFTNPGL